jgi:Cobalamin-independent synthase, Catalytic domain
LSTDRECVADNQHPDHQHRIDRSTVLVPPPTRDRTLLVGVRRNQTSIDRPGWWAEKALREKHEPVSDIDTATVGSLKALDPNRAIAAAMRVEYQAIVNAGFVLQIDDPGLPDTWDMLEPHPTLQEYKRYATLRVEALNHALAGIPEDRVRYHICWGSWHGPHTTDIPLRDVVDVMLGVKAQAYSVEAGNVRHEHEYKVWHDVKLPEGKILIPGVISHATNVVEHPEVVADRIVAYAKAVGRENVVAGSDCGLGGRVHPQIAWAKLQALAEGARRASAELWGALSH